MEVNPVIGVHHVTTVTLVLSPQRHRWSRRWCFALEAFGAFGSRTQLVVEPSGLRRMVWIPSLILHTIVFGKVGKIGESDRIGSKVAPFEVT
jgi:hypothetical protein